VRASTSQQSFTLQANQPTNAAPQQLSTLVSQVVDRWATAILSPVGQLRRPWPKHTGESAGATTRFEVNNSHLLPEQGAHISSSSRTAGRGRLLTVTMVAMLYTLTTRMTCSAVAVIVCAIEAGKGHQGNVPGVQDCRRRDGVR
jgi:hypothetical protein